MPDTRYTPPVFPAHTAVAGADLNTGFDQFGTAINAVTRDRLSPTFRLPQSRMAKPKGLAALTWEWTQVVNPTAGPLSLTALTAPLVVPAAWDLLTLQVGAQANPGVALDAADWVEAQLYVSPTSVIAAAVNWPRVTGVTAGLFIEQPVRQAAASANVTAAQNTHLYCFFQAHVDKVPAAYPLPPFPGFLHATATLWYAARHDR